MSFLTDLYGRRPDVPNLPRLDIGAEQQKSIQGNLAALPGAEQLVGESNLFSQQQITQMLNSVLPGYSAMRDTATANIRSELSGQLPGDVSALVQNRAAGAALSGGTSGSQFGANITARDLGLTSLQLTQTGLNSAESWLKTVGSLYEPSQINVGSMFISPQQQYAADNEQNLQQFQNQWMRNQIEAMPDPVTVGLWNTSWSVVDSVLGAYTGGMIGPGKNGQPGLGQVSGKTGDTPDGMGFSDVSPGGGEAFGTPFSGGGGAVEGDFGAGFGGGMGGLA